MFPLHQCDGVIFDPNQRTDQDQGDRGNFASRRHPLLLDMHICSLISCSLLVFLQTESLVICYPCCSVGARPRSCPYVLHPAAQLPQMYAVKVCDRGDLPGAIPSIRGVYCQKLVICSRADLPVFGRMVSVSSFSPVATTRGGWRNE